MPPAREVAWLQKADNDLLAADNNLAASKVPFDAVCFHCQQAAEKSLKGLLGLTTSSPSWSASRRC
jgi:HEPN domain-containing protein